MSLEEFSYLARTGKAIWLFEGPLQDIKAPKSPLVCITPIVDGKPRIDLLTHVDPLTCPVTLSEEFDGTVMRTDYLAAYVTPLGLNVHDLLHDDFTEAIKLLYERKHYVSKLWTDGPNRIPETSPNNWSLSNATTRFYRKGELQNSAQSGTMPEIEENA